MYVAGEDGWSGRIHRLAIAPLCPPLSDDWFKVTNMLQ
jgi:hypothetical protein